MFAKTLVDRRAVRSSYHRIRLGSSETVHYRGTEKRRRVHSEKEATSETASTTIWQLGFGDPCGYPDHMHRPHHFEWLQRMQVIREPASDDRLRLRGAQREIFFARPTWALHINAAGKVL